MKPVDLEELLTAIESNSIEMRKFEVDDFIRIPEQRDLDD
jgi:hypothetical protein